MTTKTASEIQALVETLAPVLMLFIVQLMGRYLIVRPVRGPSIDDLLLGPDLTLQGTGLFWSEAALYRSGSLKPKLFLWLDKIGVPVSTVVTPGALIMLLLLWFAVLSWTAKTSKTYAVMGPRPSLRSKDMLYWTGTLMYNWSPIVVTNLVGVAILSAAVAILLVR